MKLLRVLSIAAWVAPLFAQYAGPAILTRGEAPAGLQGAQISFRPFFEFSSVYDTGLAGVGVDSKGQLGNTAAFGLTFTGGVSGAHSWKHTSLGLDYRGSVYHYTKTTYYDGSDQSLMLSLSHQFTRHTSLTLRESAGLYSRPYGMYGLPSTIAFDPATTYNPTTDFYDNRAFYVSSQADYTIQKSQRLSFNLGGDGYLVRRRSTALFGVSGAGARADMQYRFSRRSTVGVGYNYEHFAYHGIYSGTDFHSIVGTYGVRITRNLEFSLYGGILRAETTFIQSVPIDPAIAAVIGIYSAPVINHRIDHVPNISGRLSRRFEKGVVYLSGGHSVTPGNGLFLTSVMTTGVAGYTYTGIRHWSFAIQALYDRGDSIGNYQGTYGDLGGNLTASRQIARSLHAVASFYARRYQSASFSGYNRLIYTATLGLGFPPGDIPLRIW